MNVELAWASGAEAIPCAAAVGADNVVAAYTALPPAPDAISGDVRRAAIGTRILVELVNAGHYGLAVRFCEGLDLDAIPWTYPSVEIERSILHRSDLLCLAVLALQCDDLMPIEQNRDRFGPVARIIEQSESGSACDLMAASYVGQIAALGRLGGHDPANALRETSSRQAGS
jgi:hypothetical protein